MRTLGPRRRTEESMDLPLLGPALAGTRTAQVGRKPSGVRREGLIGIFSDRDGLLGPKGWQGALIPVQVPPYGPSQPRDAGLDRVGGMRREGQP